MKKIKIFEFYQNFSKKILKLSNFNKNKFNLQRIFLNIIIIFCIKLYYNFYINSFFIRFKKMNIEEKEDKIVIDRGNNL